MVRALICTLGDYFSVPPPPTHTRTFNFFSACRTCTGKHTIFGRISKGMRVVQKIGLVETNASDRLVCVSVCLRVRVPPSLLSLLLVCSSPHCYAPFLAGQRKTL